MKSVFLIVACLIAVPAGPASAELPGLIRLLAQEDGADGNALPETGEPDQDVAVERGAPSTSTSSKVTPVTQSYNVQGVIMLFLMAAALFPICKSSARGR